MSVKRSYLDANVLVKLWQGDPVVDPFFREVEDGICRVFVSHFAFAEVRHTIKKIVLEDMARSLSRDRGILDAELARPDFASDFTTQSASMYATVVDLITSNEPDLAEREIRYFEYPQDMFFHSNEVLTAIRGEYRAFDMECPRCGRRSVTCSACGTSSEPVLKAVNVQDILHVQIAKSQRCDELVTAEKAFTELEDEARPLEIRILK